MEKLADGRILIAGGYDGAAYLSGAELYDPAAGVWSAAPSMGVERVFHTLTRTSDGRLLAAGGQNASIVLDSAEYYDPGSNTWNPTGPMESYHDGHAAILLNTGKVLVVSGLTTGIGAIRPERPARRRESRFQL
jgi:hypothetical protein